RKNRGNFAHKAFISLTVVMYSISTVHVALSLKQCLIAFFEQNATNGGLTVLNDPASPWQVGQPSLAMVNCIIGDSIVAWRAWVLWGGGRIIIILPALLIVTGAVTGSLLIHAYATTPMSAVLYDAKTTLWVEIFGAVTFTANLYAIGIIAYKAWQHERAMNGIWSHGSRVHRALLIFIESGAIYCLVLVGLRASKKGTMLSTFCQAVIVVLISVGNDFGVIVGIDIIAHLTGIYPSIILILVSAKLAYSDEIERNATLTSMRYNRTLTSRQTSTTGRNESGSYALDPTEFDLRMHASHSETSSKAFLNNIENVGCVTSEKRLAHSEETVDVTVRE
ncbi:hypothetical protein EIP86_001518, partial [Pleurotus ostreatoroseus]